MDALWNQNEVNGKPEERTHRCQFRFLIKGLRGEDLVDQCEVMRKGFREEPGPCQVNLIGVGYGWGGKTLQPAHMSDGAGGG